MRALHIALVVELAGGLLACTQVAGLDGDYQEVGGAPQATGMGGGLGSNGSTPAGSGGVQTCRTAADCPASTTVCATPACQSDVCGFDFAPPGTFVSGTQKGDCKVNVCDGVGNESTADDDTDVPDDGLACTIDTCTEGAPGHTPAAPGSPCTDGGGRVCDGAGQCVDCVSDADCNSGLVCQQHVCVPPTCVDGRQDGNESDIDCGGSCAPCGLGQSCTANVDCAGGLCSAGACAATCTDGVMDQNETAVDCGGVCGATCALGNACSTSADCASGYCGSGICQSACVDGKKDFGETDVDCGGPCPNCAQGKTCANQSDCQSGTCMDGVCCDKTCAGVCEACTAVKKGGGIDGVCGPVAAGTDPDSECITQDVATCGNDGTCNGNGACGKYAAGTVCTSSSCLNATAMLKADLCDGSGICVDGGLMACGAYLCAGAACRTSCTADTDCAAGNDCSAAQCAPKKALGDACAAASECSSSFCADGVCCESACTGKCMACSVVKKGQGTDGKCEPIRAGADLDNDCATDPAATCGSTGACDGAGACAKYAAGTLCATAACSGSSFQPAGSCNGTGSCIAPASVACSPYACGASGCLASCTTNADCAAGHLCVAPACQ